MLFKIGLGVVGLIVLLLVVISTRPATFAIERAVSIEAPAEAVFSQLVNLHAWERWNPFEKGDPTVVRSYSGVPGTIGSSFHYSGEDVGEGRMTIVDAVSNRRVTVQAEFIKPFAATNAVEFTLEPDGKGVLLRWTMSGENDFLSKAVGLVMDMDRMIGSEFEKGLADIRRLAEESDEPSQQAPVESGA